MWYLEILEDTVVFARNSIKIHLNSILSIIFNSLCHKEFQIFEKSLSIFNKIFLGLTTIYPLDTYCYNENE